MNETLTPPADRQHRRKQCETPEAAPAGAVFLTKRQIALALQVSVRCVTSMMRRGELPYVKLNGKFVRFNIDDVRRRLAESSAQPVEASAK